MIYLGSLCCIIIALNKVVATLAAVVELRGTKLHIFKNLSITIITVEQLWSSGKLVIKSSGPYATGSLGIEEANTSQRASICQV